MITMNVMRYLHLLRWHKRHGYSLLCKAIFLCFVIVPCNMHTLNCFISSSALYVEIMSILSLEDNQ